MTDPYYPQCIITGCSLFQDNAPDTHLNGDLFEMGDFYIFNGNPAILQADEFAYAKTITISAWFERRHVFIFHKTSAVFNDAAVRYVV